MLLDFHVESAVPTFQILEKISLFPFEMWEYTFRTRAVAGRTFPHLLGISPEFDYQLRAFFPNTGMNFPKFRSP
jgi:hypothetical protein